MKLLVVGDSFSFGAELPDASIGLITKPSELAWPALLGKQLGYEVVNLSIPGGSNNRIFRLSTDESIDGKYDLVICGWTEVARLDLRLNNVDFPITLQSTGLHNRFPWVKEYYALHYSEEQSYQIWLSQLITLQNHFKFIKQPYIFVSMNGINKFDKKFDHLVNKVDKDNYIGWHTEGMTSWMGDCAKGPGGHPLELGHERIADKINEHIRNLSWLP
jgi:hypothetical protein